MERFCICSLYSNLNVLTTFLTGWVVDAQKVSMWSDFSSNKNGVRRSVLRYYRHAQRSQEIRMYPREDVFFLLFFFFVGMSDKMSAWCIHTGTACVSIFMETQSLTPHAPVNNVVRRAINNNSASSVLQHSFFLLCLYLTLRPMGLNVFGYYQTDDPIYFNVVAILPACCDL